MTRTIISRVFAALAACLLSSAALAAPKTARILYAEPVVLTGLPALPAAGRPKTSSSAHVRFDAYGRRFELDLTANDRLLRQLPAALRAGLPAYALYRGTVAGLDGSWVRLTRLPDGLHGLVYDGTELYVVAPAGSVASELDPGLPRYDAAATLVFRAADTDGNLGPGFCRVLAAPDAGGADGASSKVPAYQAIFAELKANAPAIGAAVATKELDLALVGDTQLATQYPSTAGEMLARLNNIDGIFSAQVGVRVTSSFVQVLGNDGGMTATSADTLLDQFETYRRATPQAASRGLAHLMTGRELDGTTVGIAYVGTLCSTRFSASLSQTYRDTFYSSLVAAHEIGHNFGAQHDGESGSTCATTPQTFLMAPVINGSSTFSQCSLDHIAPVVNAATCLATRSYSDVAAEIADSTRAAFTGEDVHVTVDVVSKGTAGADLTVLTLGSSGLLSIAGATVTGGTCALASGTWTCTLGTLAAGEHRPVDVVVRGGTPGSGTLLASATAAADVDATNGSDSLQVTFATPADGALTVSPTLISGYVGQLQSFTATASNAGPRALENAVLTVQTPINFELVSASGSGATCTTVLAQTTCTFGSLDAGASRQVQIDVRGLRADRQGFQLSLGSSNDSAHDNDDARVDATAFPNVELTLTALTGSSTLPLERMIVRSFLVRSIGPTAASDVTFQVLASDAVDVYSAAAAGAQCSADAGTTHGFHCRFAAPIESGGSRQVDVQLLGRSLGAAVVDAVVAAPDNQHIGSSDPSRVTVTLQVRSMVDVRIEQTPALVTSYDHVARTVAFDMTSIGATPADNSRFSLTLPAGVRATAAQSTRGTCAITSGAVNCTVGALDSGEANRVTVTLVGDAVASYTLTATATADGDTVPADDAWRFQFNVLPNTNVGVAPLPSGLHVRQGVTFDYTVTLQSATQPVSGTAASLSVGTGLTVLDGTPSQGSCSVTAGQLQCTLGAMPANAAATIVARLRADAVGGLQVDAFAAADNDVDAADNHRGEFISVDPRGNVSLAVTGGGLITSVGASFDLARFTVTALAPTDGVVVDLTIPASFSIDSAIGDGAPCAVNAGSVSCTFGSLASGATRGVDVRLRANQAGTFTISGTARAADDADLGNNAASQSVTVEGSGSGGGGGGGGATDPAGLLLLLLGPALARRRRAVAR